MHARHDCTNSLNSETKNLNNLSKFCQITSRDCLGFPARVAHQRTNSARRDTADRIAALTPDLLFNEFLLTFRPGRQLVFRGEAVLNKPKRLLAGEDSNTLKDQDNRMEVGQSPVLKYGGLISQPRDLILGRRCTQH